MKINISPLWEKLGVSDELSLGQQMIDVYYGAELNTGTIIHINSDSVRDYVQQNSNICGYINSSAINYYINNRAISSIETDRKHFPYFDNSLKTNVYSVMINWDELKKCIGLLHDREATEPFGIARQKQIIKNLLKGIDNSSKSKRLEITEKILGEYSDHATLAQVIRGDDSPDRNIQLIKVIRELNKDGYLTIFDIEYDLSAVPLPAEHERTRLEQGFFIDEDAFFCPAEHCHISLELARSNSEQARIEHNLDDHMKHIGTDNPQTQQIVRWNELELNIITGWAKLGSMKHRFKLLKPHYSVLKLLIDAQGAPVSYEQFFSMVKPDLINDPKNGKDFIRQKVRDIRKHFKINRKKNYENDIFYDTGDGYQLMKQGD